MANAKLEDEQLKVKKGRCRELIDTLFYDGLYSFIDKYAFDRDFKRRVLNDMMLAKKLGNYKIEAGRFIGEFSIGVMYHFNLEIKNYGIYFEERYSNRIYKGKLVFSNRSVCYACYKTEEVVCHHDINDGIEDMGYDTYNVEIEKGVTAFNKYKLKVGGYKEKIRENYILKRDTGEKFLKKPSIFENYIEESFTCRIGDNIFVREVKNYTHPDRGLDFSPLRDMDCYYKGGIDEDYFFGISKEVAESFNFNSDEEIKQYKKLIIS